MESTKKAVNYSLQKIMENKEKIWDRLQNVPFYLLYSAYFSHLELGSDFENDSEFEPLELSTLRSSEILHLGPTNVTAAAL